MARELKHYVTLREHPASSPVCFGPGDKLPEWAVARLKGKDHLFTLQEAEHSGVRLPAVKFPDGDTPQPKDAPTPSLTEPAATELGKPEVEGAEEDEDDTPRRNASRIAWAEFAGSFDPPVPVTAGMSRDDIIKACEDARVIPAE